MKANSVVRDRINGNATPNMPIVTYILSWPLEHWWVNTAPFATSSSEHEHMPADSSAWLGGWDLLLLCLEHGALGESTVDEWTE